MTRPDLVEARGITHSFGRPALQDVGLRIGGGEIHALLGPNGAGKTTLLRVLGGLLRPDAGALCIAGCDAVRDPNGARERIGFVPSGGPTLYPRLSGLENLVFFGRLQGFSRRDAIARSRYLLELVGLSDDADKRVYAYSHGMQKRLAFARALLTDPDVLLLDEVTHDLDPSAAVVVRALTRDAADRGAAVVWATQRLDEIRGFADAVTLLSRGEVCFAGTVPDLLNRAVPSRYLVTLHNGGSPPSALVPVLHEVLGSAGTIAPAARASANDYTLTLADGHTIGDVLAAFAGIGIRTVSCREERSGIEEAFVALVGGAPS